MTSVSMTIRDGVALLMLDGPRRNALTLKTAEEIEGALSEASTNDQVSAVIVSGKGPVFCSGADRRLLASADADTLRRLYRAFTAVRECPLPTVAAVNGPAVGAGLNLALACDVRIAAHSAVFDPRFLEIPVHPGGGHLWMLERAVGRQVAAAATVFGHALPSQRAYEVGLIWQVVPDEELLPAAMDFCAKLVASPIPSLARKIKASLDLGCATSAYTDALEHELKQQVLSMATKQFRDRIGGQS